MKKQKNKYRLDHVEQKHSGPILADELSKTGASIQVIEAVGSSIMHMSMQSEILTEEILMQDFGMTEEQINKLRNKKRECMGKLVMLTRDTSHPLGLQELRDSVNLTRELFITEQARKMGIVLPTKEQKRLIGKEN